MVYLIKKLPRGKSFVGLNEIFLELWSNKALPSCHHSMGTSEPPLPCLSLSSCQAQSCAEPGPALMVICPSCQLSTAWERGLCIQQSQSSACHWSPPFRDDCGTIYASYKVLRSLTQLMENLWPRLTSNPQPPNLETVSGARSTVWPFWGRPFAESNSILIRPKQNWRNTWLHNLQLQMLIYIWGVLYPENVL